MKRLIEKNDPRGLGGFANRVRNILAVLVAAETLDEVVGPPGWRIHPLGGNRAGTWSIATSGNWRITFRVDGDEIIDLDLEDYH